jgi:hypothetical protein
MIVSSSFINRLAGGRRLGTGLLRHHPTRDDKKDGSRATYRFHMGKFSPFAYSIALVFLLDATGRHGVALKIVRMQRSL